jgi:hypothetical protein
MQVSMSGISVSEDAVNMYYFMKAKSTVSGCCILSLSGTCLLQTYTRQNRSDTLWLPAVPVGHMDDQQCWQGGACGDLQHAMRRQLQLDRSQAAWWSRESMLCCGRWS